VSLPIFFVLAIAVCGLSIGWKERKKEASEQVGKRKRKPMEVKSPTSPTSPLSLALLHSE
jgi:hypothetical protein